MLRPEDESAATNIADDDDYREVYTAGLEYYPDINGPVNLDFHYAFYLSDHHDLDAYNVQNHSLSVVPSYDISDKRRVSMALPIIIPGLMMMAICQEDPWELYIM